MPTRIAAVLLVALAVATAGAKWARNPVAWASCPAPGAPFEVGRPGRRMLE